MSRAPDRQSAFTLIELLVAISIFAVFALMAYGGLSTVMGARAQVERINADTRDLQMTLFRFEQDLEQVRARPIRDEFGDLAPALRFDAASRFGPLLEFTRGGRRNPLNQDLASLQRMGYALEDEALVRLHWTRLDRGVDEPPARTVMMNNVIDLRWRFLGADRQWQEEWPAASVTTGAIAPNSEPPIAIEVTLETERWGLLRGLYRLSGANGPAAPAGAPQP